MPNLSLMGPNDLQLWLEGRYLCGKEWSRGFITNSHSYENPLELWKYYHRDTDGVAGSDLLNGGIGHVLIPGKYDTSLQNRKQMPDTRPFTATHSSLLVERRSPRNLTAAHDLLLSLEDFLEAEARLWYELYFDNDDAPFEQGMITEFPNGYGPEGDFTTDAHLILRNGMNNYSAIKPLPKPRVVTTQLLAKVIPVHGVIGFTGSGGSDVPGIGLRNTVYWFKQA